MKVPSNEKAEFSMTHTGKRYDASALRQFAQAIMQAAGFEDDKAAVTARHLVDADMMGHDTHGLNLLVPYVDHAVSGGMELGGDVEVIADRPAAITWDGRNLPGVWVTDRAVDVAIERARTYGQAAIAIRRSHHIACLQTYLPKATDQGMMVLIASSDPHVATVAPYGGRKPLYTPDPVACGIPTDDDPILIDISASITTNGMSGRLAAQGRQMDYVAYLDADGEPTREPSVITADPPGSILPLGGVDYGHKGYGLALMIEAMTQGLSGFGRSAMATGWGASVYVQVMDPAAFAGGDAFNRETGWLARACRDNPPRPGVERVRLPGERALARMRDARENGVQLYPGIMDRLLTRARELDVATPDGWTG
ncbi:MAG: Ldh family oxidoreductase [Geminicoccaceae bacterium]